MTVSPVSATTPAASTTSTPAPASTNSLSYNDFLTLLMSELQNQHVTRPMDPGQMVSRRGGEPSRNDADEAEADQGDHNGFGREIAAGMRGDQPAENRDRDRDGKLQRP
jgi:hypothetical protein